MARVVNVVKRTPFVIPMSAPAGSYQMPKDSSFEPEGLAVWGATEETFVQVFVNAKAVFPDAVPALMFASALSFEEMRTLPMYLLPKLVQSVRWRNIPDLFPTIQEEETLELNFFRGPISSAVFWGTLVETQE